MLPPFIISQAQLAELGAPPQGQQRDQLLLEMAALWLLYEPQWQARFVCALTYEERKEFFGQVHDWGMQVGLEERHYFLTAGVLLLRAVCQGWPPEDLALARGFIAAEADDPASALAWLAAAFD